MKMMPYLEVHSLSIEADHAIDLSTLRSAKVEELDLRKLKAIRPLPTPTYVRGLKNVIVSVECEFSRAELRQQIRSDSIYTISVE